MEMSVMKEDVYHTHSSLGTGDVATTGRGGADPETLEPRRQKEGGEDVGKSLYCAFHGKDRGEAGGASVGLASLNHFSSGRWAQGCHLVGWPLALE